MSESILLPEACNYLSVNIMSKDFKISYTKYDGCIENDDVNPLKVISYFKKVTSLIDIYICTSIGTFRIGFVCFFLTTHLLKEHNSEPYNNRSDGRSFSKLLS